MAIFNNHPLAQSHSCFFSSTTIFFSFSSLNLKVSHSPFNLLNFFLIFTISLSLFLLSPFCFYLYSYRDLIFISLSFLVPFLLAAYLYLLLFLFSLFFFTLFITHLLSFTYVQSAFCLCISQSVSTFSLFFQLNSLYLLSLSLPHLLLPAILYFHSFFLCSVYPLHFFFLFSLIFFILPSLLLFTFLFLLYFLSFFFFL